MTNYEKIKNMSVEEMAKFFGEIFDSSGNCDNCIIKLVKRCSYPNLGCDESAVNWLESEVEE